MNEPQQQLKLCLEQTQLLYQAARDGEWEGFEAAVGRRNLNLDKVFTMDLGRGDQTAIRKQLDALRALDRKLLELVEANRKHLLEQLKTSNQGRKMKAAYGKTKRPY